MPSRLWDESINVAVRDALGPLVPIINRLTHFGDGPLLIVAAVLLYWFGAAKTRRERAFVIAVGTAAFALATGIKGIFQLPRPPLAFAPEAYPGFTFPSAHAMGAAAFYGALAVTMRTGTRRQRYAVAGTIIVLVSLSRVTLGVHFLGDVVVGAGLGLLLVWLGIAWRREGTFRPGIVFLLAGAIAVGSVLAGSREYASMVIGAGFGGAAGWWLVADRPTSDDGAAILVTGIGVLLGIAVLRFVTPIVGGPLPGTGPRVVFVGEIVAYGVLTALMMVVPALAVLAEGTRPTDIVARTVPFRNRTVDLEAVEGR